MTTAKANILWVQSVQIGQQIGQQLMSNEQDFLGSYDVDEVN